jgi:hypothetical protein
MSDVDFSTWLTEDCCTPDSPESDFDELFSQITYTAASGDRDWHAVDWLSFDDLLETALNKAEVIELQQEPAEAVLPELAREAVPKEPSGTAAEIILESAAQEPAEGTSPVLAPELVPQELTEARAPEMIRELVPILGEKPHNTEV